MFILECNDVLSNCCNDGSLLRILNISRNIVELLQTFVPIILILMLVVHFFQLTINPEMKNGKKKITNKIIAAIVVFFVPSLVEALLGLIPNSFELSACWKSAKLIQEIEAEAEYVEPSNYQIIPPEDYSGITPPKVEADDPSSSSSGSSSVTGEGAQRMINVATGELGNNEGNGSHTKYTSYTNLSPSDPWCAAFVSWVAGQAGFIDKGVFPSFTYCPDGWNKLKSMGADMHREGSGYRPQAGDIVFFDWYNVGEPISHVGIVTGSDDEYVYTIEGNTSCTSGCNGTEGVSKKTRLRNHTIYGYATPRY